MKPYDFFDLSDFEYKEIFVDLKYPWEALVELSSFIDSQFFSGKLTGNFAPDVFVHPEAEIDPTAKIIGPAIISKGAKVGFNAYIRENVYIGKNTIVGHACEVKNSLILNNTHLSHFNYVGDSVLGSNINFGAGAKTANLRLDKHSIVIKLATQEIDTGLEKFGVIIGDNSSVGVNAVFNPGTILGKHTKVYPLTLASGFHPETSVIK